MNIQEGKFRFQHAIYRTFRESILYYGEHGENYEKKRLDGLYLNTYDNSKIMIRQNFYLNMSTNWFAYLGSIVSYAVIGNALLNSSSGSSASEIAGVSLLP